MEESHIQFNTRRYQTYMMCPSFATIASWEEDHTPKKYIATPPFSPESPQTYVFYIDIPHHPPIHPSLEAMRGHAIEANNTM